MRFEKINNSKFKLFSDSKIAFSHAVYGGYAGETNNTQTQQSDQEKSNGNVDYTDYGSGKKNDGFK